MMKMLIKIVTHEMMKEKIKDCLLNQAEMIKLRNIIRLESHNLKFKMMKTKKTQVIFLCKKAKMATLVRITIIIMLIEYELVSNKSKTKNS